MRVIRYFLGIVLPVLLWQAVVSAQIQRMSYSDTKRTIERIKHQGDKFKDNFDDDVHRAGVDSSVRHDMKQTVDWFEETAEHLDHSYSRHNAAESSVRSS